MSTQTSQNVSGNSKGEESLLFQTKFFKVKYESESKFLEEEGGILSKAQTLFSLKSRYFLEQHNKLRVYNFTTF